MSKSGHLMAGQIYYNKFKAFEAAMPNGWWPHWDFYKDRFQQIVLDLEYGVDFCDDVFIVAEPHLDVGSHHLRDIVARGALFPQIQHTDLSVDIPVI